MTTTTSTQSTATILRPTQEPAPRYVLDPGHSHVSFAVRHLMISNVRGEFTKFTGDASYDAERPEDARLTVSVDVASISTREEKRDAHLRSADFFDVERFPRIEFKSTGTRVLDDGLAVDGELTMHGVTRPVTLTVEEITPEHVDPWGNVRFGATAKAKLRRSEFGMTWNSALETGGFLVSDDISIQIEAELIKQQ